MPVSDNRRVSNEVRELIIELDKKVDRVISNVEIIKEKQDEINRDLSKIKDPDTGLFARVKTLEDWKSSQSKLTMTGIATLVALIIKQFWDLITIH